MLSTWFGVRLVYLNHKLSFNPPQYEGTTVCLTRDSVNFWTVH